MKVKTSFVTNSSTCNFVAIGWQLDRSTTERIEEMLDLLENYEYANLFFSDHPDSGSMSEDHILVGKLVTRSNDEYFDPGVIEIEELLADEDLERFKKDFNIDMPYQLIVGSMSC